MVFFPATNYLLRRKGLVLVPICVFAFVQIRSYSKFLIYSPIVALGGDEKLYDEIEVALNAKAFSPADELLEQDLSLTKDHEGGSRGNKEERAPSLVETRREKKDDATDKIKDLLDKTPSRPSDEKEDKAKSAKADEARLGQEKESHKETIKEETDSEKVVTTKENEPEKQEEEKKEPQLEECGCPHTDKIKTLMKNFGNEDCTPSDCTNYKLDTTTLEKPDIPFEHYEKVVMATKVHFSQDIGRLQQMICLFNAAYNRHAGYYDIVVFSTMPWTEEEIKDLQDVAYPAKVTVVRDSPPLEDVLKTLTEDEVNYLKDRCHCPRNETLGWYHHCQDVMHTNNLAYSWQSEFRAYHLWNEPILADYKYMIWMDSDALPTKMWDKDPMKLMVENDLVLMFDNFPGGGRDSGNFMNEKIYKAYNKTFSNIALRNGHLESKYIDGPEGCKNIPQVHGFHHITNLDFYRSERTQNFLKILVGDYKFSRLFDDQIAVAIPAEMDAPEKSWDYRQNGLNFGIHHNGDLDGKERNVVFGYHLFHWKTNRKVWIAGAKMCNAWIVDRGRR